MKYENLGKVRLGWKRLYRMNSLWIWIAMALMVVAAAGCVSEPSGVTKNETLTTPVTTYTPVATDVTPSTGQQGVVPPAPYQLYIKAGQIYKFTYGGIFHERRNFTVNYVSAYPTQIVKISFDGHEKTIQKELTESPKGVDWSEEGFTFNLWPVVWEIREDNRTIFQRQRVPLYEKTWNTTELYLDVWESK